MPIHKETLEAFLNPIFVETGTYRGAGIQLANELGFERIYSVDIDPGRVKGVLKANAGNKHIHIEAMDSPDFLKKIMPELDKPTTFWLDAHPPGYDLNRDNCPVWDELDIIRNCPVPYIVLIDDMVGFKKEARDDLIAVAQGLGDDMEVIRVVGHLPRTADILAIYPNSLHLDIPRYTVDGELL